LYFIGDAFIEFKNLIKFLKILKKVKYLKRSLLVIFILILSACQDKENTNLNEQDAYMQLLPASKTGIDFNNSIQESEKVNQFYSSQIYNGAGVAIGDLNNDGLPDVFFCGNMVSDRLYLNKGEFKFKDITSTSKVGLIDGWSWGVTMADVNVDGFLDIYVSRNGQSMNPNDRKNLLYINNGDLTFTESAQAYGLDDMGFSSQAVFFDMDNDGDLDMFQVNQPPDIRMNLNHAATTEEQNYYTDKLYINDNGHFRDVSKQAGIIKNLTFGLSVSASDFNNDGFVDLYVSNDFDDPDYMYYNNGDGTFINVINEKLKHISIASMGSDTGDVNNDGLIDLMTLDMAAADNYRSKTNMGSMSNDRFNKMVADGKHHQYMQNTLQINTGKGSFYDIASMTGIAKTDWSWGTLLVDLDNDGYKDIIITNGIKKDIRNNDFLLKANSQLNSSTKDLFKLSNEAPSTPLPNYIFRNKGNLEFENVSKKWGFDLPGFSSGVAYGDLDNDGDLDIITNNMGAPAFVYENKATNNFLKIKFKGNGKNTFAFGAKAIIHRDGKIQVAENTATRGYLSSVEPDVFFGLGKDKKIDSVEVVWPDGKVTNFKNVAANTTLKANYNTAKFVKKRQVEINTSFTQVNPSNLGITYIHKENEFDDYIRETLIPHKLSQNGPFSTTGDVNGDGLSDLFIGGASGQGGVLYLQQENGLFKKNSSQPWELDKKSEDLGCIFLDVDGDKDLDLYVTSGGGEFEDGNPLLKDRLYINNGKGVFKKDNSALPNIYTNSQSVKTADVDGDGDLDLFVGTRLIAGKYPYPASSYILINKGGKFKDLTTKIAPALQKIGMVTDAVFTDIDKDGDQDLMLVGEWMQIILLENQNGRFVNSSKKWGLDDTRGMWWSITASDLDNDGDDDYIIGNLGKNNKFKATEEHPFKVYANDFDHNGTNDVVLAKFYKDGYVPQRGRECSSNQMPFIAKKFKNYDSFASSKLIDILPKEGLKDAVTYEIKNFESIILINEGEKLIPQSLPFLAQVSPIKSSYVADFNNDGNKDILTVGNHYETEVETTRYDAGIGCVLLGDGKNNFHAMTPLESGLYVPFDSRNISLIKEKNKNLVLITNNNEAPSIFIVK
jgi:enediyne biosynthesis protein E4